MSTIQKISVALLSDMVALLRSVVDGGEYASASDVICEALRDWTLKRNIGMLEIEALRHLVQEGINSGPSADTERVFARLRRKYAGIVDQET